MSITGTLIRTVFAIVALVAGTNAAAYWTVYTRDRLETAASLREEPSDAGDLPRPYEAEDLGEPPVDGLVDPGVGCFTDTW